MNIDARISFYRGMIYTFASAIYNGEDWDKQAVAAQLCMGDPSLDYVFDGDPPETLTDNDISDALDRIIERAGI